MSMTSIIRQVFATDGLKGDYPIRENRLIPLDGVRNRIEMARCNYWRSLDFSCLLWGFYIGLLPALARDVPFSAIYYTSYRKLKELFPDQGSSYRWWIAQVSTSFTSGIIASFVTQPADVIKTYRQVAPDDYRTISSAMKAIRQVDGRSDRSRTYTTAALLGERFTGFCPWFSLTSVSSHTGGGDDMDSLWIIFERKAVILIARKTNNIKRCRASRWKGLSVH